MKKLTLAPAGHWQRSNGQIVPLDTMLFPHLVHAHRIVIEKLTEATRTRDRIVKLQDQYGTHETEQGKKVRAEVIALVDALTAKREELNEEINRRPTPGAP